MDDERVYIEAGDDAARRQMQKGMCAHKTELVCDNKTNTLG